MKVETNDMLAATAIALGVGQLLIHTKYVLETDDVSSYSVPNVLIGIIASILWLLVQYRTGANYSTIYTSMGLASQVYILHRVVSKLETKRAMK